MKQGFRQLTLISCYLKDDETRSVLINWSGHQTKRTQKAEPDTVIDEQIYYIRLQREPRSKHITRWVKLEIHDVMGATCPAHKYRLYEGAAANACLDYYSLHHGINNYCGLVFVCTCRFLILEYWKGVQCECSAYITKIKKRLTVGKGIKFW